MNPTNTKNEPTRRGVAFYAEAQAAARRNSTRHNVLQAMRRNTRGLPLGFNPRDYMRPCDINRIIGAAEEAPLRVERAIALHEALEKGARYRQNKRTKFVKRVIGKSRIPSTCVASKMVAAQRDRRRILAGRA